MNVRIDYETLARRHGWTVADCDPIPEGPQEPTLYDAAQDRVWPLGDWRGACKDMGLLDGEAA